jgi:hypothetical protein
MENIVFSEQIFGQDAFCLPDDRYQTDPRQIVLDASDPAKLGRQIEGQDTRTLFFNLGFIRDVGK